MQNVLKFPEVYAKKRAFVNPITRIINNFKERQERKYQFKVKALKDATFKHFLKQLKNFKTEGVEIPAFMTAERLTNVEIKKAELQGRKFIDLCYKELKKSAKK